MSLQPATYAEALEKARSRPQKPRTVIKRTGLTRKASLRVKSKPAKRKAAKKAKRKRLPSMKSLKKRVWFHFSVFIRTQNADEEGYVQCVTCPERHLWNSGEIHAGHWIHNRLDFEEKNVHPQCVKCNYHWNTKVNVSYSIFMARTYGVEVMEELRLLSNAKGNRYTRIELDELLEKYKSLNAVNPVVTRISC